MVLPEGQEGDDDAVDAQDEAQKHDFIALRGTQEQECTQEKDENAENTDSEERWAW